MKITKWVDMGEEVEVEVSTEDIRAALAESFAEVTKDLLGELPSTFPVVSALSDIGKFLRALSDEQIALLNPAQRRVVGQFLAEQAARFREKV
jgi:hypothetical protein